MLRAYYYDDVEGDQRLPHDSGHSVDHEQLESLGVMYVHASDLTKVNIVASQRGYRNRDEIRVCPSVMGEAYESKIKSFFDEHMHDDEEIRYIMDGRGYFDIRDQSDQRWIRLPVTTGDLLVLPPGIYHRFTTDEKNYIKAMRLFKDEPKWTPHSRASEETDRNPFRQAYVASIH